jgi:flagellin
LTIGDATNSETFEVNGVAVTTAPSDTAADIVQKINDAGTGATASVENLDGTDRVVLTDETGRNITVEEKSGGELFNGIDNEDELSFEAGLTLGKLGGSPPTTAGNAAGNLGMSAHQVSAGVQATVEDLSVATRASSNLALLSLDKAIDQITSMRADLGAIQNRFENVIEVAGVQNENLSAARSRIQDAGFAAETANLTRAQILQQAGLASLAQANASPQAVLALLR